MAGILTIEDDPAIRRGIVDSLRATGYVVWESSRADDGLTQATSLPCDLVLLDLVLPAGSGLEVLQAIRRDKPTLPVIILSARGEEQDRVRGLRFGADDYVVKPFSVDELLARVEAVLRRSPARGKQTAQLSIPGVSIDWARRELIRDDGETQTLSEREASLLSYLARHPGRPIDRDELLRGVWQIDATGVSTRTVDMHIARLRDKLRTLCDDANVLTTVRGAGYFIDPKWTDETSVNDSESP